MKIPKTKGSIRRLFAVLISAPTGLFQEMRNIYRDHQKLSLQESIKNSYKQVARCQGELAYYNKLTQFYSDAAERTKPAEDWWRYAEYMEARKENKEAFMEERRKQDIAQATLLAQQAKAETLDT